VKLSSLARRVWALEEHTGLKAKRIILVDRDHRRPIDCVKT
jgi:hypothetical protein